MKAVMARRHQGELALLYTTAQIPRRQWRLVYPRLRIARTKPLLVVRSKHRVSTER